MGGNLTQQVVEAPFYNELKNCNRKYVAVKAEANQACGEQLALQVQQGKMTQERSSELQMRIDQIVTGKILSSNNYDVSVQKDMIDVRLEPGTVNIIIDMLYYDLGTESPESDRMSI